MGLKQAVAMNNTAVFALTIDSPGKAYRTLRKALSLVRAHVVGSGSPSSNGTSCSDIEPQLDLHSLSLDHQGDQEQALLPPLISKQEQEEEPKPLLEDDTNAMDQDFFEPTVVSVAVLSELLEPKAESIDGAYVALFDRALYVEYEEDESSQNPKVLTAVILYNMGLVSHCHAICFECPDSLRKALRTYQLALRAMSENFCPSTSDGLVLLAIHNNIAAIYASHMLAEEPEMNVLKETIARMGTILNWETADLIDDDEYIWFAVNVMCRQGNELAPAA
jgi:hypothetical protein